MNSKARNRLAIRTWFGTVFVLCLTTLSGAVPVARASKAGSVGASVVFYFVRIDQAGARPRVTVRLPAGSSAAIRSQDAKKVVFLDSRSRLLIRATAGGATRLLSAGLAVKQYTPGIGPNDAASTLPQAAAYSPDGRRLTFTGQECGPDGCGPYAVYVVGADGSGLRVVASPGQFARWSPTGRLLTYVWFPAPCRGGATSSALGIAIVPTDGDGVPICIATGVGPTWAPRGQRIAFQSSEVPGPSCLGVCVIDANGANRRTIASDGASPVWSPDGTRLAIHRDSGCCIAIYTATGRLVRRLTGGRTFDQPVAWSSDGRRLAYLHRDPDAIAYSLRVIQVATGASKPVAVAGSFMDVRWSRDSRYLSYAVLRP